MLWVEEAWRHLEVKSEKMDVNKDDAFGHWGQGSNKVLCLYSYEHMTYYFNLMITVAVLLTCYGYGNRDRTMAKLGKFWVRLALRLLTPQTVLFMIGLSIRRIKIGWQFLSRLIEKTVNMLVVSGREGHCDQVQSPVLRDTWAQIFPGRSEKCVQWSPIFMVLLSGIDELACGTGLNCVTRLRKLGSGPRHEFQQGSLLPTPQITHEREYYRTPVTWPGQVKRVASKPEKGQRWLQVWPAGLTFFDMAQTKHSHTEQAIVTSDHMIISVWICSHFLGDF